MAESSSTKRTPRITVIVPSFRDRDQLEKTLTALRAQTLSAAEFDVVVVNNDPETPLDVDASGLNLTTATESEPGSYAARAAGLAVATTELLAFTDAGCLPRTDWLEEGLAGLDSDPRPDVVDQELGTRVVREIGAVDPDRRYSTE